MVRGKFKKIKRKNELIRMLSLKKLTCHCGAVEIQVNLNDDIDKNDHYVEIVEIKNGKAIINGNLLEG